MRWGCSMRSTWASMLSSRSSVRPSFSGLRVGFSSLVVLVVVLVFGQLAHASSYGPDITAPSYAISGGYYTPLDQNPGRAFNNELADFWGSSQVGGAVASQAWIGQMFSSPVHIRKVSFVHERAAGYQMNRVAIQAADTLGSWVTIVEADSVSATVEINVPASKSYLYWRLAALSGVSGPQYNWVVYEVEMRELLEPSPSPSPSSSPSASPTPPPGQTTNPDGSIDVRVNVGVEPIDVRVNMPSSVDLKIPVIQDPAWVPVWEKLFYVLLKVGAVLVIAWFLGRLV